MDWKCRVHKKAFDSGSGCRVETSDFYEELDYKLNRISGPTFIWYVSRLEGDYVCIALSSTMEVCDTTEKFESMVEERLIPILTSMKVKGIPIHFNKEYKVESCGVDRCCHDVNNTPRLSGYIAV